MTPRPSRKGDEKSLKALWHEVFGDTDVYIDTFFRELYRPGMASVVEEDGKIVAAAYAVPFGTVRYDKAGVSRQGLWPRGSARRRRRRAGVSLSGQCDAPVLVCAHNARENGILPLKRPAPGRMPEDHGGGIQRTA